MRGPSSLRSFTGRVRPVGCRAHGRARLARLLREPLQGRAQLVYGLRAFLIYPK